MTGRIFVLVTDFFIYPNKLIFNLFQWSGFPDDLLCSWSGQGASVRGSQMCRACQCQVSTPHFVFELYRNVE